MEAIRKQNPKGVDFKIDQLQKRLEKDLCQWNIKGEIYPRCYTLEKENGRTIEHYKEDNEYSGHLVESEGTKIFFLAENTREQVNKVQFKTNISLYGILDLSKIDYNNSERKDEEVLSDVIESVRSAGYENLRILTNFYEIFNVSYFKDSSRNFRLDNDNIHPYFYFRIDFDIIYELNQNC